MVRTTDWLGQAEAELKAARDLLATDNYAWCCFTSHQAAEKALKAILEHLRARTPGNNLNELIGVVEQHIAVSVDLKSALYSDEISRCFCQWYPGRTIFPG